MSFFFNIKQKQICGKDIPSMKFGKLSRDKKMYDFERMSFYILKTVFTEILKTRKFKWHIVCVYKCISSHMKLFFFLEEYSFELN